MVEEWMRREIRDTNSVCHIMQEPNIETVETRDSNKWDK